jgi:hypothetical protein
MPRGVIVALAAGVLVVAAGSAGADTDLGSAGGLSYRSNEGTAGANSASSFIEASCAPGSHVVGGGVILGATTHAPGNDSYTRASRPFGNAGAPPKRGWRARVYNDAANTEPVTTYAVCTNHDVRYRIRSGVFHKTRTATALCPAGTHVTGGGASLGGAATESRIVSSYPFDGGDPGTAPDDGWKVQAFNESGPDKRLTVFAACWDRAMRYTKSALGDMSPGGSFSAGPACDHLTGGGVRFQGAAAAPRSAMSIPEDDGTDVDMAPDDSWRVGAHNGGSASVSSTVFAACRK